MNTPAPDADNNDEHHHFQQQTESKTPPNVTVTPPQSLSPTSSGSTSSASSRCSSEGSSSNSTPKSSFEAFFATRSRVVWLYNLPPMAETFLGSVFYSGAGKGNSNSRISMPVPATMWEERCSGVRKGVWAVFGSHEEACLALTLGGHNLSVATALEKDLEPFHKLKPFLLLPMPSEPRSSSSTTMLRLSASHPDLSYTLSSNPPNPKTSFRFGDWICPQPKCAAHNFGRNLSCIGCGCPRSGNGTIIQPQNNVLQLPSPRFASAANTDMSTVYYSSAQPNHQQHLNVPNLFEDYARSRQQSQSQAAAVAAATQVQPGPHHPQHQVPPRAAAGIPPKPTHPILTPSGRAFAIGGKVQNISSDPLSPCIMYWPDNEPFPEQGQIRPSNVVGVTPPILNTGNRGPISHQPGDWICQKCNYLNWRRRKVCQTCLPYAEGNGDSISAAVQAERIALLTQVLSQTQLSSVHPGALPTSPSSNVSNHGGVGFPSMMQAPTSSHTSTGPGATTNSASNSPTSTMATAPGGSAHSMPLPPIYSNRSNTLTPPQVRRNAASLHAKDREREREGVLNLVQHQQHLARQQQQLGGGMDGGMLPHHRDTNLNNRALHRAQSHLALQLERERADNRLQAPNPMVYSTASPIYQTSGARNTRLSPSPLMPMRELGQAGGLHPQHQQQPSALHHQLHREPSPLYSTGPPLTPFGQPITTNANNGFNCVIGSNAQGNLSRVSLGSNASSLGPGSGGSGSSSTSVSNRASPIGIPIPRSNGDSNQSGHPEAPPPLLPSFLQDIVQSPSLSPTSTTTLSSSAELSSVEDDAIDFRFTEFGGPRIRSGSGASGTSGSDAITPYASMAPGVVDSKVPSSTDFLTPTSGGGLPTSRYMRPRVSSGSSDSAGSVKSGAAASIWKMDGEESKSLGVPSGVSVSPEGYLS
ncbi:hypothetical protein CC2G_002323 [Coprinopsis cinerea AmutBmut pab1-1]|nr:hypothetical protein CC2G_002323 [Coprinopsis cinerea AmutBmut pab1-1]